MVNEWERFLLAYGDAAKSTPHLYLSALSWLPTSSRLWDIVHESFSSDLPIILSVQEEWNDEKWSERVGSMVMSVAYSANGSWFAAGCWDGSVRFWKARSGKRAREPLLTESAIWSIALSHNNLWLASGQNDGSIRLWDLRADLALPRRVLEGHTLPVRSIAFSSNGEMIVSGSDDMTIRVWNVESGTVIGEPFRGHDSYITSVTFSTDNTRIISGSDDKTVRVWYSKTGKQIRSPLQGHSEGVTSVACSRDGRFIASGSDDKTIRLWDALSYKQVGDPYTGHAAAVKSVCFSSDSMFLASGSSSIRVWSVPRSEFTEAFIMQRRGHTNAIQAISFSPNDSNILSGSLDGTVRVWANTFYRHGKTTFDCDFQPDPARATRDSGQDGRVTCVSYVPNRNFTICRSNSDTIRFWDTRTGAMVGKPLQPKELSGVFNRREKIDDDKENEKIKICALAVSSDGQWLVSGLTDGALHIWDIASGTTSGKPMLWGRSKITSVAFSPNSKLVASASCKRTVCLWDVATCRLIKTLEGYEDAVNSVAFSVDGAYVFSGSLDHTVRM